MVSIGSDFHILGVGANLLKPCQSKHPQAVRRFGLGMMIAWMHEQRPCCHCMVVSIGSDAQHWVSDQTSSSLEEVWLGHDDSMDEHDQTLLQSKNGFDWQRCPTLGVRVNLLKP